LIDFSLRPTLSLSTIFGLSVAITVAGLPSLSTALSTAALLFALLGTRRIVELGSFLGRLLEGELKVVFALPVDSMIGRAELIRLLRLDEAVVIRRPGSPVLSFPSYTLMFLAVVVWFPLVERLSLVVAGFLSTLELLWAGHCQHDR